MPALRRGEADAVIASHAVTATALKAVDFTDRYYHPAARFAGKRGQARLDVTPEGLEGKKIAVTKGTAHEAYLRAFFRDSAIRAFETPELARDALITGSVDLLFDDGVSLVFWLNGTASRACCEFKGGPFGEPKYFGDGVGIAVNREDVQLKLQINGAPEEAARERALRGAAVALFPAARVLIPLPLHPDHSMLPAKDQLTICFAHSAYRMAERFAARATGIRHVQVSNADQLTQALPDADVVVVSMMWRNQQIDIARKLKFIQSISAGVDQYDQDLLRARGIRLASAAGVNAQAVAEHAMALILALRRKLHISRDNQMAALLAADGARHRHARGRAGRQDPADRRPRPHRRAAGRARQGVRHARHRHQARCEPGCRRRRRVFTNDQLPALLGRADVVALTCPLTPATENLIDAKALGADEADGAPHQRRPRQDRRRGRPDFRADRAAHRRRRSRRDARGASAGHLAAVGDAQRLDHPHIAGETQRYEDSVIDILLENLDRQWRGETALRNQIV